MKRALQAKDSRAKEVYFLILAAALLAGASCIYLPGLTGPFQLDDFANVTLVTPGTASIPELADVAMRNESGLLRRPVSNLTFALNYFLTGPEPLGYKATNVAIHWIVGVCIYLLLLTLCHVRGASIIRSRWLALTCSLIWLVHPLQVSTALYVVQRMAMLSTLFTVLGLYVYCRWRNAQISTANPSALRFQLGYWVCFVLAVLSKENGVLLPCLVLVIEHWVYQWRAPDPFRQTLRRNVLVAAWIPIALGAVALLFLLDRFIEGYQYRDFTMPERLATQGPALLYYLRLIFTADIFSMGLYHDDFPIYSPSDSAAISAWLAILVLIVVSFWLRKRLPLVGCGIVFFFVGHGLESSFIGLELVWEHRNYLSMVGVVLAIMGLLLKVPSKRATLVTIPLAMLIVALVGATILRTISWSDTVSFANRQLSNHPFSARANLEHLHLETQAGLYAQGVGRVNGLRSHFPDEAWPDMLYLLAACTARLEDAPEVAVSSAAKAKHRKELLRTLRLIVERRVEGQCPGLGSQELDAVLVRISQSNAKVIDDIAKQRILLLRARLARGDGELPASASLLEEAIDLSPGSYVPLLELGYLHLNEGNLAAARQVVQRMRRNSDQYSRDITYLADELEAYIEDAERARDDEN